MMLLVVLVLAVLVLVLYGDVGVGLVSGFGVDVGACVPARLFVLLFAFMLALVLLVVLVFLLWWWWWWCWRRWWWCWRRRWWWWRLRCSCDVFLGRKSSVLGSGFPSLRHCGDDVFMHGRHLLWTATDMSCHINVTS